MQPRFSETFPTPQRFLSFAIWDSREAIEEYRSHRDFKAMIDAMRPRLHDMQISTLEHVLEPDE